jgi:formiminotetrahydrofolate cyclodeaminase
MKTEILQDFSERRGLENLKINEFLEAAASADPVPGGGSIAALTAASAAALIEMVANLTVDKKSYEAVHAQMMIIKSQLPVLRQSYLRAVDEDADAFSALMDTLRLPKEEAGRAEKVQAAFMRAAEVPLALGQAVFPLLGMARTVVADGNAWAIAAMNARSAMRAAFYSVRVNLQSVEDAAYVYRTLAVMADYEDRADYEERLIESIYKKRR